MCSVHRPPSTAPHCSLRSHSLQLHRVTLPGTLLLSVSHSNSRRPAWTLSITIVQPTASLRYCLRYRLALIPLGWVCPFHHLLLDDFSSLKSSILISPLLWSLRRERVKQRQPSGCLHNPTSAEHHLFYTWLLRHSPSLVLALEAQLDQATLHLRHNCSLTFPPCLLTFSLEAVCSRCL